MADNSKKNSTVGISQSVSNRRRVLKAGAIAVPTIVTMRSGAALAQTAVSAGLANCTVTIPENIVNSIETDPARQNRTIQLTAQQIEGIFAGTQQVPGTDFSHDYVDYLNQLRTDMNGNGFSCISSIVGA